MVLLAIKDNPLFNLDMCEVNRKGLSYTLDTLKALKRRYTNSALCLIMGVDAFVKLQSWYKWEKLITYCHIVIVNRSCSVNKVDITNSKMSDYFTAHLTNNKEDLTLKSCGYIYLLDIPTLEISSSYIRALVSKKRSVNYLVPKEVEHYIIFNKLYNNP